MTAALPETSREFPPGRLVAMSDGKAEPPHGRDCRLEEEIVFLFDNRHQINVVVARDDEITLPGVFRLVRVSQNVQQPTGLDRDNNALE